MDHVKNWSVEPPRKNHELVGAGWLNRQTVLQVGLEQTDASFTLSQVGDGDVLKCVGLCEVWGSIQTPGVGSKKSLYLNRLTSTNFVNEIKAMDFRGTVPYFQTNQMELKPKMFQEENHVWHMADEPRPLERISKE